MDRDDAESMACGTGWLSLQPGEFQRRLLTVADCCHVPPGTHIYEIGDPPDSVFALVDGELSILRPSDDFTLQLVHVARPVWWVGEAAVITNTPRRATLVARQESVVLRVSRAAIEQMAAEQPDVWRRIAQITVSHLDTALSLITGLSTGDARSRVALALHRLASLDHETGTNSAVVSVSQQELGAMTRLSRNAVGPIILELETAGLVVHRYRRIEILDIAALARFATDANSV
jgi:CRP/FNR family cyclic AMP-dependent transcriptional regulator